MEDMIHCPVIREDFQQWLEAGTAPFTVWQGDKADTMFLRLGKRPSVDYLYRTAVDQDNAISWSNGLTFFGAYDIERRRLYLTKDALYSYVTGKIPLITEIGASLTKTINNRINQRVEDIIANDRNNLPIKKITGWQSSQDLEYYRDHGVKESVIRQLFSNQEPDSQFHSDYKLSELPETAFTAYITDPELFVQTEAEQYIKNNQEKFLLQFLKTDALLAEYQALMQDTDNPIHRMKAITDAVKGCDAKTVTVTVQKDGQELTFKAAANSLTGHRNYYSTSEIPASDRREFERLFGRHTDYNAEDIVKITYGRNTIYEAPEAPAEEMGPVMQMGGM